MPVSEKLLSLGKEFGTDLVDTVIEDDEKKKKKGKVSQRLLDVGKRIEFLDKKPLKTETKTPPELTKEYRGVTQPEYTPDYSTPEGFIDYDSLGATREERTKKAQESFDIKEKQRGNVFDTLLQTTVPESTLSTQKPIQKEDVLTIDEIRKQERQEEGTRKLIKSLQDYEKGTNVFGTPNAIQLAIEHEKKIKENPYSMTSEEAEQYYAQNQHLLKDLTNTSRRMLKDIPVIGQLANTLLYHVNPEGFRYAVADELRQNKSTADKYADYASEFAGSLAGLFSIGGGIHQGVNTLKSIETLAKTNPKIANAISSFIAGTTYGGLGESEKLSGGLVTPEGAIANSLASGLVWTAFSQVGTKDWLKLQKKITPTVIPEGQTIEGFVPKWKTVLNGQRVNVGYVKDKGFLATQIGNWLIDTGIVTAAGTVSHKVAKAVDDSEKNDTPLVKELQKQFTEIDLTQTGIEFAINAIFTGSIPRQYGKMPPPSVKESKIFEQKLLPGERKVDETVRETMKPVSPTTPKDVNRPFETTTTVPPPVRTPEEAIQDIGLTPEPPITELQPGRTIEEESPMLDVIAGKVARGNEISLTDDEKELQRKYPNYIKAIVNKIKESPDFQEEQRLKRQKAKERIKAETDNYVELNRQFKSAQRKRILFDAETLRNEVGTIKTPEIRTKAEKLLKDAVDYNDNLKKRNEFTLENLSRKKYGTTDLNSLDEQKQKDLLNEYNEMKKQGIKEFGQIKSIKPIIKPIKEEDYAIRERSAEEILQRKPEEIGVAGSKRGQVEPSIEGIEPSGKGKPEEKITEAEEEGFIKRQGKEEAEPVKQEDDLEVEPESTDGNKVAIKRMIKEGKTPEEIAQALKVNIDEVEALAPEKEVELQKAEQKITEKITEKVEKPEEEVEKKAEQIADKLEEGLDKKENLSDKEYEKRFNEGRDFLIKELNDLQLEAIDQKTEDAQEITPEARALLKTIVKEGEGKSIFDENEVMKKSELTESESIKQMFGQVKIPRTVKIEIPYDGTITISNPTLSNLIELEKRAKQYLKWRKPQPSLKLATGTLKKSEYREKAESFADLDAVKEWYDDAKENLEQAKSQGNKKLTDVFQKEFDTKKAVYEIAQRIDYEALAKEKAEKEQFDKDLEQAEKLGEKLGKKDVRGKFGGLEEVKLTDEDKVRRYRLLKEFDELNNPKPRWQEIELAKEIKDGIDPVSYRFESEGSLKFKTPDEAKDYYRSTIETIKEDKRYWKNDGTPRSLSSQPQRIEQQILENQVKDYSRRIHLLITPEYRQEIDRLLNIKPTGKKKPEGEELLSAKSTAEDVKKLNEEDYGADEYKRDLKIISSLDYSRAKDVRDLRDKYDRYGIAPAMRLIDAKLDLAQTDKQISKLQKEQKSDVGLKGQMELLSAKPEVKDLIAVHNLTAENLKFADKVGGLAMPSMAIVRKQLGFSKYGEITLIAPKDMIDPEYGTKVYGRDIYSPTYPTVYRYIDKNKLDDKVKEIENEIDDIILKSEYFQLHQLRENLLKGNSTIEGQSNNELLQIYYLTKTNQLPELILRNERLSYLPESKNQYKIAKKLLDKYPIVKEGLKLPEEEVKKEYDEIYNDKSRYPHLKEGDERQQIARDAAEGHVASKYQDKVDEEIKKFVDDYIDEYIQQEYLNDKIIKLANETEQEKADWIKYHKELGEKLKNKAHPYSFRKDIEKLKNPNKELSGYDYKYKKVEPLIKKQEKEYLEFLEKEFDNIFGSEYLLKGKQKIPNTLDNAIDIMGNKIKGAEKTLTQGIAKSAGEAAKQFTSIENIKKYKDKLISHEQFEVEEKKLHDAFFKLADELRPYSVDKSEFGWNRLDDLSKAIGQIAKGRVNEENVGRYLRRNGYNVPDYYYDDVMEVAELMKGMPTEYFEAKKERPVRLKEFVGAIVPDNASQKTLDILKKNGIEKVEFYKYRNDKSRQQALNKFSDELFSARPERKLKETNPLELQRANKLSPQQVLNNLGGIYPTPTAVKEARQILGDKFDTEYEKFKKQVKPINFEKGEEDLAEGKRLEMFARRTIVANKLGVDELLGDKFYVAYENSINETGIKKEEIVKDDFGNEIKEKPIIALKSFLDESETFSDHKTKVIDSDELVYTEEEWNKRGYPPEERGFKLLTKGDKDYVEGQKKYRAILGGGWDPRTRTLTFPRSAEDTDVAHELIHAAETKAYENFPTLAKEIEHFKSDIRSALKSEGRLLKGQDGENQLKEIFDNSFLKQYGFDIKEETFPLEDNLFNAILKLTNQSKTGENNFEKHFPAKKAKTIATSTQQKTEKGFTFERGKIKLLSAQPPHAPPFFSVKTEGEKFKPAPKELIEKVHNRGLVIDQNLIATYKVKTGEKEYISVSTPDKAVTKMIEVNKIDDGLKLFETKKRFETLSPKQILTNSSGLYSTPIALKDAQDILGEKFITEFEKFADKRKGDPDYPIEDREEEKGYLLEAFARRVVAAKRLGIKDIETDLYQEALKWDKKNNLSGETSLQLKKPKKDPEERFFGKKTETEIAREKGEISDSNDGNIVDFGAGLGQVFTTTADKISDFIKNSRLEKELGIEGDSKLKKYYREFLTAPQWFFDKEPQLKRIWDIIDRHFVRNVNEEVAILREDKWKNGGLWRNLTDIEQKEFLSALEEYEFIQYELQRDGEDLELLDWADFANEFNLTPKVTEFLFQSYKPVIETALDMVKDVDKYKIINETQHNPYLQDYYEVVASKAPQQRLDNELEKAKDEFFNDDPNAEALYENELNRMIRANKPVSELRALELTWVNNPNLRETLVEVLIDKKYERIDGKAYFPSSRLDKKYFLSAIRKTTPEQKLLEGKNDDKHFTTNDSLDKLNRIKTELETIGYKVKVGKFAEVQEEILANAITQEDILDLALSAGIENYNPVLERLVKTIQAKGFSRHFIPKRFIPGFEYITKNFEEALFKYINSVPFYKNRTIGGKELEKTMADLKQRKILKPGSSEDRYIQDLKTKVENRDVKLSQALRAVASAYYLALSPAYLSQQIVQPLNTLLPYLPITAKELGLKPIEAEKAFAEAIGTSIQYWAWKVLDKANRVLGKTSGNTFGLDRDFLWHMRALERQGVGKPLRSMELTGQEVDPQKHYVSHLFNIPNKAIRWTSELASIPGIAVEDFTRTIGMRAYYILGRKAGLTGNKLQDFISNSIAKSYGPASGRLAKPPGYYIAGEGRMKPMKELTQSVIESWLTFKNFAFMNYGQWGKTWRALKEDKMFRPLAYKLGAQIGIAGLKYIMWAASILTLMSGIYAILNITEDPEEQYEELFLHFNKLVPGLGDALYKGIASLTFKVDLSALFAQTAPIEEPFTQSAEELIGGAPISAAKDIIAGRLPRAFRGFQQAKKYEEEGVELGSRKLIPPEQISEADKTKRKLGYTPLEISKAYQKENTRQFKSSQYTDIIRKQVTEKIIPLIEQGRGREARQIFAEIFENMKADSVFTERQLKSITGVNSFISQAVLTRLEATEREIIKNWKNGVTPKSSSRDRTRDKSRDRTRERTR